MATHVYECMFILDTNRYARDPGGVSGQVQEMIEKCGGELLASRLWNEQKLAYPIDGHRKGTYWLTYFRLASERIVDLRRACQLNENVVRHLTIKVDPRLVEPFVAHARGETVEAPPGETPATPAAETPKAETPAAEGETPAATEPVAESS